MQDFISLNTVALTPGQLLPINSRQNQVSLTSGLWAPAWGACPGCLLGRRDALGACLELLLGKLPAQVHRSYQSVNQKPAPQSCCFDIFFSVLSILIFNPMILRGPTQYLEYWITAEAWSTQQNFPGDRPGDHLVGVERSNYFAPVRNPRCRKQLLSKAWHRRSLAKAACRSPQGLRAEQDVWKECHDLLCSLPALPLQSIDWPGSSHHHSSLIEQYPPVG